MRKAFIVLCGLFTVLSAWAIYRDSRLGVRRSAARARTLARGLRRLKLRRTAYRSRVRGCRQSSSRTASALLPTSAMEKQQCVWPMH